MKRIHEIVAEEKRFKLWCAVHSIGQGYIKAMNQGEYLHFVSSGTIENAEGMNILEYIFLMFEPAYRVWELQDHVNTLVRKSFASLSLSMVLCSLYASLSLFSLFAKDCFCV